MGSTSGTSSTSSTPNPAPLPPNPDLEKIIAQIDTMLTFLVTTDESEGLSINYCSPIWEGFGSAIRRLGKRIYRTCGHDGLLIAAQIIVLRNPCDRNARMEILYRRWDGIGGDVP